MASDRDIKKQIRSEVLTRRDALSAEERAIFSDQIKSHFLELEFVSGAVISAFLPIRSEVDLHPVLNALLKMDQVVCLPAMLDGHAIEFRQYDLDTVLVDNGFGTRAPSPDSNVLHPDVMLIPLSAFVEAGNRIGYGAGYYDRAIMQLRDNDKDPLLIGVAFSCQQVDQVPSEDHDAPLDMVITENGLLIAQ